MKLALIVQRYGRDILGGSETLARQLAERLSRRHDITVFTTTASDYITWKNVYEPGEEKHRGVRIRRFPVEGERDIDDFNKFSEEIYQGEPTREQELEWLKRQGPVSPELIESLKKEHGRFDLLVFFTYLYYPTYYGLQVAPEKSVLVPTAHDEPPLKLSIFQEMFQLPSSFLFNTEAEELLVLERFPVHKKMRETIGMGMELLDQPDPAIFRKRHDVSANYFLYAGRIDGGKGMEELFRFFSFYKEENPASGNLQLILIGKLGMKLPEDKSIRYVGFVDEAEKLSAMAGAVAVLQPSKMESLSIVTLEAFSVGTPVIVNGASRVLIDHCRKANAGFYYGDFEEFEEVVSLLLSDRNLGRSLGKNGQRYVKDNYGWQKLLTKYELALRASGRPIKEAKEPRRRSEPQQKVKRDHEQEPPKETQRRDRADEPASGEVEATSDASSTPLDPPVERVDETPAELAESNDREPVDVDDVPSVEAVSESDDPDATIAITDDAASSFGAQASEADEPEPEPEPQTEPEPEPEAEPSVEASDEPADEPVDEPVDEDVAHLPSFFRAAIPPKKPTKPIEPLKPDGPDPEEPAVTTGEASPPKPTPPKPTPPPPPPPPPPSDGGLPEFFRPKQNAAPEAPPPDPPESSESSTREEPDAPPPEQAS